MVRYLFYTIGDLTYQSPLVQENVQANWHSERVCMSYGHEM